MTAVLELGGRGPGDPGRGMFGGSGGDGGKITTVGDGGRCEPCINGNHTGTNGTPGCRGRGCGCPCRLPI